MKFLKSKTLSKYALRDNTLSAKPSGRYIMNGAGGVRVPAGTTSQRPQVIDVEMPGGSSGLLRYNTELQQFEGFSQNNWTSLGGVRSVDGRTFVSAELAPGVSDDTVRVYADGVLRVAIDPYNVEIFGGQVKINGDVIVENELRANTIIGNIVEPGPESYGFRIPTALVDSGRYLLATTYDNQVIDSQSASLYRSVKYWIQASLGNSYQYSEVAVIHDGDAASLVEFGHVSNNGSLIVIQADIFNGNLRLLASPIQQNVDVKFFKFAVDAGTNAAAVSEFTDKNLYIGSASAYVGLANTVSAVDLLPVFTYNTVKYYVQASAGNQHQYSEITVSHNYAEPYILEYSVISTSRTPFVEYSADFFSGNLRLLARTSIPGIEIRAVKVAVSNATTTADSARAQFADAYLKTVSFYSDSRVENQPISLLSAITYRSVKCLVHVTNGSKIQTSEIIVLHDGLTAYVGHYGVIANQGVLADFSADVKDGSIRLLVSPRVNYVDVDVFCTALSNVRTDLTAQVSNPYAEVEFTANSTDRNQVVDSLNIDEFASAKYQILVTSRSSYQSQDLVIAHNGVSSRDLTSNLVHNNDILADFSSRVTDTKMQLLVSPRKSNINVSVIRAGIARSQEFEYRLVGAQLAASMVQARLPVEAKIIDQLPVDFYKSAEYRIQAWTPSDVQYTELVVIHNGEFPGIVETQSVSSNGAIAQYYCDIFNGQLRLLATPFAENVKFSFIRRAINGLLEDTQGKTYSLSGVDLSSVTRVQLGIGQHVADSFDPALYKSTRYQVCAWSGSSVQSCDVVVSAAGDYSIISVENINSIGNGLVEFSSTVQNGQVEVLADVLADSTTIRMIKTAVSASTEDLGQQSLMLLEGNIGSIHAAVHDDSTMQEVDRFASGEYSSVKYEIQAWTNTTVQLCELLLVDNGVDVGISPLKTNVAQTSFDIVDFQVQREGSDVVVYATGTLPGITVRAVKSAVFVPK